MGFIGIGQLSKYYIYSIVAIICQLISDYCIGLNKINKPDPPEFFKYYAAINRHFLA